MASVQRQAPSMNIIAGMERMGRKRFLGNAFFICVSCALALSSPGIARAQADAKEKGSVCIGAYAPLIIQDNELKRVYLTIGKSDKIFFDRKPGTLVLDNLDLQKTYVVRVFYDSAQVKSWDLRFDRLGANLVTIWRSAGYWRMERNRTGKCVWPLKAADRK
jgi:hypothetical protein